MTERLHFHFLLSCIGEGNGNPLQCSCLENPRDGGAWWAAAYGVAQSQTRLKRLSSSSSPTYLFLLLLLLLLVSDSEVIAKIYVKKLTLYIFLQEFIVSGLLFQVFNPLYILASFVKDKVSMLLLLLSRFSHI